MTDKESLTLNAEYDCLMFSTSFTYLIHSKNVHFQLFCFSKFLDLKRLLLQVVSEMEFKEFQPRFKSAKTRFKFSADLNLETFDTIFSGTNHI